MPGTACSSHASVFPALPTKPCLPQTGGAGHGDKSSFQFSFHPCKVMFIHHLQQQVFGTGIAVDAAGSVLYLQ